MPDINYLAVLVAGIAAMVVGGLWYGPLFGKLWMQGMGWDPNDQARMAEAKKGMAAAYVQMFVFSLVQAFVLAHVLWAFRTASPDLIGAWAGIQGGFWVWLGFVLPLKYGDKLWGGKKFKFVAVDLAYYLVLLCVMGIILSVWK
ncbi:MAG: DUF1761 domain-containing protein [Patescibacteria group bacterium]